MRGIPARVAYQVVGEVTGNFTEVTPATGIGGAAEGEPKGKEEKTANKDHGRDSGGGGIMEATVGGFPVDFGLEDDLGWVAVAERNNLVDVTEKGPTKHARSEEVPMDTVVDRAARTLDGIEGLVMSDPKLIHNLTKLIDCGLFN
jgi:hypothetical protein